MMESIVYGDIVLIDLNPVRNEEISKIRPCVVVSNRVLNQKSPFLIIIPFTGSVEKVLSWHVVVKTSKKNGLAKHSKILPEQIRSVSKKRCIKKMGCLNGHYKEELERKLLYILNQRQNF